MEAQCRVKWGHTHGLNTIKSCASEPFEEGTSKVRSVGGQSFNAAVSTCLAMSCVRHAFSYNKTRVVWEVKLRLSLTTVIPSFAAGMTWLRLKIENGPNS